MKAKIYYVTENEVLNDITLQYGIDAAEDALNDFYSYYAYTNNDFYYASLNDNSTSIIIDYYKDIAPWADILVIDPNNNLYMEEN